MCSPSIKRILCFSIYLGLFFGAEAHNIRSMPSLQVRGLKRKKVCCEQDAFAYFLTGETSRSIANHTLNHWSSRSHCIYTVHLEIKASVDAAERSILSKLNLVDLAGSERTKKSGVTGELW